MDTILSQGNFQVGYRWRLNNNRYLFITDNLNENGKGVITERYEGAPFIYYYMGGSYFVSYFDDTNNLVKKELDSETSVDEAAIAIYTRTKFKDDFPKYEAQFKVMRNLMFTDEYGAELTLLSAENYFDLDAGEGCAKDYSKVDCDLYDLSFSGSVYKIPYGKEPLLNIVGPINVEQYKRTLKTYRMTFGLPQGPRGERGTFDEMTPNYMEEDETTYFPIFRSNKHPYTTYNEEKKIGLGIRYNVDKVGSENGTLSALKRHLNLLSGTTGLEILSSGVTALDDYVKRNSGYTEDRPTYTIDVTREEPNPEYGYYVIINNEEDTRYEVKDISITEDEGYMILTFDDTDTIPGGDGYYYKTLFLMVTVVDHDENGNEFIRPYTEFLLGDENEVILGNEENGIKTNNGFIMAFKWEDDTNTPYFKNEHRFIFNDAVFTIRKYIKTRVLKNVEETNVDLKFGQKVDVSFDGSVNFNDVVRTNSELYSNAVTANTVFSHSGITTNKNVYAAEKIETPLVETVNVNTSGITASGITTTDATANNINATGITVSDITTTGITATTINTEVLNSTIAYETSDIRKKNILDKKVEFDIDKILELSLIYFTYKDDAENKERIGVIAQEIKEICPEIVWEDENGILNVEYNKLTILLLYCVKDLYKKIR